MRPRDLGTLFDVLAERGSQTSVRLSRPLDIAPELGTTLDVPAIANLVRDAAGWLAAAGVRPADRVAIVKDNHWDYVLLSCAAVRIGAIPAQISGHLPPDTLQSLMKRLGPSVVVTNNRVLSSAGSFATRTLSLDESASATLNLGDVRGSDAPPPHRRGDDEPLVVMHTSGTTGAPKLVVHSTTTMIHRLVGFEARRWPLLATRPDDTVANALAFAHGRAIAWTASVFWLAPRKAVIVADGDPAVLSAHPPTTVETLPATYVRWQPLAESGPGNPFRDVRLFVSTFDAMHPPTVRAFLAATRHRRPLWMQGWGQSETGPITFRFLTRKALAAREERHPTTRNVGRPVPLRVRTRVVDPQTFQPVPHGRPGVVMVRTKALCLGYVGEQDRWESKRDGDWWNTGDIGIRGRTGSVSFVDREVDVVPGLSCVEIEDVVDDRLPEVLECVVLGAPGRLPLPVVVTADGTLDAAAWREAVRDLPPLAEPVALTWDQLPRTGTGKVRRMELRERLLSDTVTYGSGRWT